MGFPALATGDLTEVCVPDVIACCGACDVCSPSVDMDSDLDVICSGEGNDPSYLDGSLVWYENLGGGSSWTPHSIVTGAPRGPRQVVTADVGAAA